MPWWSEEELAYKCEGTSHLVQALLIVTQNKREWQAMSAASVHVLPRSHWYESRDD